MSHEVEVNLGGKKVMIFMVSSDFVSGKRGKKTETKLLI
jgi:hypothetical protein